MNNSIKLKQKYNNLDLETEKKIIVIKENGILITNFLDFDLDFYFEPDLTETNQF